MTDVQFLFNKSLYEQARERLEIAKKLAHEIGDQIALLLINREERYLIRVNPRKNYKQLVDAALIEKEIVLKNIKEELRYLDHCDQLILQVRQQLRIQDQNQLERFKATFPNAILREKEKPTAPQGEKQYYLIA